MITIYNPTYSVQSAGKRARILVTSSNDDQAAPATTTLVTLDPSVAETVAAELTDLRTRRTAVLYLHATSLAGQVCQLRRTLIGAVASGTVLERSSVIDETVEVPKIVGLTASAGASSMVNLTEAAAGLSDAERRAVADEVGRLFAGTDDVLVAAALNNDYGDLRFEALANGFLAEATDAELLDLVDPGSDGGILFEGLLSHLRTVDDDIDGACDNDWIDPSVDVDQAIAWIRRNRPRLDDQLKELLGEDDENDHADED